jgi:hypothetical protein
MQYGLGNATASTYDLACEEAARVTLQHWGLSDRLQIAEMERYRAVPPHPAAVVETVSLINRDVESLPVGKRKAAEMAPDPSECQLNSVALFHLFVNSVATEKDTPVFSFESLPGTKFSCTLRVTVNGRLMQVDGVGPSKTIAKREACTKVLR